MRLLMVDYNFLNFVNRGKFALISEACYAMENPRKPRYQQMLVTTAWQK